MENVIAAAATEIYEVPPSTKSTRKSVRVSKSIIFAYNDRWATELPDRIFEQVFSNLSGKDLLSCRLVCSNWEEIVSPLITTKCRLFYKGRPQDLLPWLFDKALNVRRPIKRFLKVCKQNPSLATSWNELRIQRMTPKSSKILVTSLLPSPKKEIPSIHFENITILQVSSSAYRFQRLHSLFSLLPNLETFSDILTDYRLDWNLCCKSFQEIDQAILGPFQGMLLNSVKNLKIQRRESGYRTFILMKILGLTCTSLENFELIVDTYDFLNPMELIDRMDYATLVALMLNLNSNTLKSVKFQWVGHLTNHYYDELLRCVGVMSWNTSTWNITKLEFHLDWIFLGNPDFHLIVVPFVQKLEKLEELKMKHIILQPEWAQVLASLKPNNYGRPNIPKPKIEFRVMLSDNVDLSAGQTSPNVIAQSSFLTETIKGIRVAISSEHTDELRKILPMSSAEIGGDGSGVDEVFPGTTELWIQRTDWKPHMRFITYNIERLCATFRNLTVLIIGDGDKLQYKRDLRSRRQWDKMSNAHIWDEDMQLILKHLRMLVTLKLRCRMVYLTDGGTVGVTAGALAEMRQKGTFWEIPDPLVDVTGYSFGNLQYLEDVSLHGLNKGITDITLIHGFKGNLKLNTVEFLGTMSFSAQGKKWIKNNHPKCYAFKECLSNGSWFRHPDSDLVWSNYTTCVNYNDYQIKVVMNYLYTTGYLISILALLASLAIFWIFRCLECTRVKIHRNLFASFLIDNILWVAWYRLIVADQEVILNNPWWCKWLYVLVQYFLISNYFWMFCEGFYLHTLLVYTFLRSESALLKSFYCLGWLGPSIPIGFYIYFRVQDEFKYNPACWLENHHQMFVTMPVCVSLFLNLIFLISILRVLVMKLNDQRGLRFPAGATGTGVQNRLTGNGHGGTTTGCTENQSLKKAVRATLILIPLLGIHYLLLPFRPTPGTTYEIIYDVVSAVSSSLQGLCVAVLFCFCNSEVITVLRRRVLPKCCNRQSTPNHMNRGESAMPTSGVNYNTSCHLNGGPRSTRHLLKGMRVQSRTSIEIYEHEQPL